MLKAIALAVCLGFGWLWGCGASADELYGTLKKIKESGTITIGRSENSVPFSYTDSAGNPTGFSIELCSHIVDAVKQELKLDKLQVRYVTIMGTTLIPLVVNGTIDMACSTTTHTLSRQRQVDFLPTMYITGNQLLVRKDSGIHEVEDLKGKRVAVNQGTTNEKIIKAIDAQEHLGITFLDTEDQPRGWLAFESGRVGLLRDRRHRRTWPDFQGGASGTVCSGGAAAVLRPVFRRRATGRFGVPARRRADDRRDDQERRNVQVVR